MFGPAVSNFERRLRAWLWEILEVLADRRNAWQMQPDGGCVQLVREDGVGSEGTHATMMRLALARHSV